MICNYNFLHARIAVRAMQKGILARNGRQQPIIPTRKPHIKKSKFSSHIIYIGIALLRLMQNRKNNFVRNVGHEARHRKHEYCPSCSNSTCANVCACRKFLIYLPKQKTSTVMKLILPILAACVMLTSCSCDKGPLCDRLDSAKINAEAQSR